MEDQIKNLEKEIEQQTIETNKKFDARTSLNDNNKNSREFCRETRTRSPINNKTHLSCVPKLEFPRFDGSNPRLWVKKCCKYFNKISVLICLIYI